MWIKIVPSEIMFISNRKILEGALNMSGSIQRLKEAASHMAKKPIRMNNW
jgi:hypothetical protein